MEEEISSDSDSGSDLDDDEIEYDNSKDVLFVCRFCGEEQIDPLESHCWICYKKY